MYYSFNFSGLTGLDRLIEIIITSFGSIALGVVIFTLMLKVLTFPLDFYSRYKMRKNSVKMEEMRPELEKLQKQYKDDKVTYNQKMMALYKKNNYSLFSGCLPTIVTLVIFIIVITSFQRYATFQNIKYLQNMNTEFNRVVTDGISEVEDLVWYEENSKNVYVKIDSKTIFEQKTTPEAEETINVKDKNGNDTVLYANYFYKDDNFFVKYYTEGGYTYVQTRINYSIEDGYTIDEVDSSSYSVYYNEALKANTEYKISVKDDLGTHKYTFLEYYDYKNGDTLTNEELDALTKDFILDIQQQKAAAKFRKENESFLWIKNIWGKDRATEQPLAKSLSAFKSRYTNRRIKLPSEMTAAQYNNLTAKLSWEKTVPNGFYIIVIISAGVSLLTQFIMMRSQKAQLELQSVDGSGAMQQKIMMWMMPIMMGVFSLFYTAAFSLYIIVNSLITIGTTLLINFIVKKRMEKEAQKINATKDKRYRKR